MKHKNIIILKDVAKKRNQNNNNKVYLIFEYYEHDLAGLLKYPVRFLESDIKIILKNVF